MLSLRGISLNWSTLLFLLSFSALATDAIAPADEAALRTEAKQIIQQFASTLQAALLASIEKDGLGAAIQVCKTEAPAIGEDLSSGGWRVARTSLKTRNANNQPDAWEMATLQAFEARQMTGESADTMVVTRTEPGPDGARFRLLKAIPTQPLCLNCHGSQLSDEVTGAIRVAYPEDKAIDYREGDIRGAFTLTKQLP
jgi:hypothetical protein